MKKIDQLAARSHCHGVGGPTPAFAWASLLVLLTAATMNTACNREPVAQGSDCDDLCLVPGAIPLNACKEVDGHRLCVFTCQEDMDCHPNFYTGCKWQADDGTMLCEHKPFPDCDNACGTPTMPVANTCLAIDGEPTCVYACRLDSECPPEHYFGCTNRSDDHSMYCQPLPSAESGGAGSSDME